MSWQIGHPIPRDGANQLQRLLDALRPERNPIDDRRTEDLLLFLYRLARQFAFYNEYHEVHGDWQAFFDELKNREGEVNIDSIRNYLEKAQRRQDNSTFLSILLAFLQMFGHLQADINGLTQKHLDFYYEQALGFRRLPHRPDEAHVVFELAPHLQRHRLPAGTALKAGVDELGNPLTYITQREVVLNQAKLTDIKTMLVTEEGRVYAAEKADSADGMGAPLEDAVKKWPLFGDPAHMQPAPVGFAIASPLLLLREGRRKIFLTLRFENLSGGLAPDDFNHFLAYGSGKDQWIKLDLKVQKADDRGQATLEIDIPAEAPPLEAGHPQELAGAPVTRFPVLRLLLDPSRPKYHAFKNLILKEIDLKVSVEAGATQPGIRDLVLQNDQGLLDAGNAFQPFGFMPARRSLFYIGSREVFSKPLENLNIHVRWANLPEKNFAEHYEDYKISDKAQVDTAFTVSFQVLNNGQWSSSFKTGIPMFSYQIDSIRDQITDPVNDSVLIARSTEDQTLRADHRFSLVDSNLKNLSLNPEMPELEQYDRTVRQGFIRLSLDRHFGHAVYSKILAAEATKTTPNFPNPPYTPAIQSISIGYVTGVQKIVPGRVDPNAQFFHLHPFGNEQITGAASTFCLPQLDRAALFLGFENLAPPSDLHLLFQTAEGPADFVNPLKPEEIRWSYLTADGWREPALGVSEILADTTLGLQKPGIMALSIGSDAAEHVLMPSGKLWLRAAIQRDPAGAAQAMAICPNAVAAIFRDENNDPNHLKKPLAAGSIAALALRDGAIKKVEQPYASFGGVPPEDDKSFYIRVSERLRHKQRAATLWDLERLVLQHFPALYEVKVIPHTGFGPQGYSEFLPGQITVAVIPKLRDGNAANPLQPRASAALREEIRRFLTPLTTHFVGRSEGALHVVHPFYEPVQLSFSVRFKDGFDAGYYAEALNEALRRRMSPWAFEEGADIRFGGKIYKSQLLAFVEEQEYVDFVTDFNMIHYKRDPEIGEMMVEIDLIVRPNFYVRDTDVAEASTAASILVSADQHLIQALRPGEYPCDETFACGEGIGCWFIEVDFLVSEK
jgi:hypothetical protein